MVDNTKTLFELFEENPVKTGARLATFLGANMMVLNIARASMPGKYGVFRRLVYLAGAVGVSLLVADKADEKIAWCFNYMSSKKYNPHNEADDNSPMDKEDEINDGEDTENGKTDI